MKYSKSAGNSPAGSKVPTTYSNANVHTGKYGTGERKGRAVNGSFESPPTYAGSHRKTHSTPKFAGHNFKTHKGDKGSVGKPGKAGK